MINPQAQTQAIFELENDLQEALAWMVSAQNRLTDQFKAKDERWGDVEEAPPPPTPDTWLEPRHAEAYEKLETSLVLVEEALGLMQAEIDWAEEIMFSAQGEAGAETE